jgi:murein DD-endopeptidase MepM/ murein hydrolase activator NlpD
MIPDSELVYGPASAAFDVQAFIQSYGGYVSSYTEEVNGETLNAAQIITRAAQNYSVNPRLLLALLEYRSGWVTRLHPDPSTYDYPLGIVQLYQAGLYSQIAWAANELNRGYYLWRANAAASWVTTDGNIIPIDPTINAGTAGIQNLFSRLDNRRVWEDDLAPSGFAHTYYAFFGDPFGLAIEPLLPAQLRQPPLQLPFEPGAVWAFTGGPHAAWDAGSGWAALDFAPPNETGSCAPSPLWVIAVADGPVVRAGNGAVIQDLDNDGYEQTGWDILYMHVDSFDRVQPGTYLSAGDRIGHPSCEGGISNATHLHLARKYNGEWIAADGSLPFNLEGWISSGAGIEYDGYLKRGSRTLEAAEGVSDLNQISR